jgi:hypothetical protein
VKLKIPTAICFNFERYGLWDYIERKEEVIAAATVDGGELTWRLTQISAGIKIVILGQLIQSLVDCCSVSQVTKISSHAHCVCPCTYILQRIIVNFIADIYQTFFKT